MCHTSAQLGLCTHFEHLMDRGNFCTKLRISDFPFFFFSFLFFIHSNSQSQTHSTINLHHLHTPSPFTYHNPSIFNNVFQNVCILIVAITTCLRIIVISSSFRCTFANCSKACKSAHGLKQHQQNKHKGRILCNIMRIVFILLL